MAVADFVARSRNVQAAFFHHGTAASDQAYYFLRDYCKRRDWPLIVGEISNTKDRDQSTEEFWREERYRFLDSLGASVLTAHHLDDCVETYLWSMLHGTAKVIPYRRNQVIRPFLLTAKQQLAAWAVKNNVPWVNDASNNDLRYTRNYVRHELMPHALKINPGLHRVVARKVIEMNNYISEYDV